MNTFQEALIEKLRLKNATQKTQMKKLLLQLKQVQQLFPLIYWYFAFSLSVRTISLTIADVSFFKTLI